MKNPGGAKFKSPTHQAIDDAETLRQLRHFDESKDKWYEFGSDTTIDCVGDLFAFYYDLPRREDLNGVIPVSYTHLLDTKVDGTSQFSPPLVERAVIPFVPTMTNVPLPNTIP